MRICVSFIETEQVWNIMILGSRQHSQFNSIIISFMRLLHLWCTLAVTIRSSSLTDTISTFFSYPLFLYALGHVLMIFFSFSIFIYVCNLCLSENSKILSLYNTPVNVSHLCKIKENYANLPIPDTETIPDFNFSDVCFLAIYSWTSWLLCGCPPWAFCSDSLCICNFIMDLKHAMTENQKSFWPYYNVEDH